MVLEGWDTAGKGGVVRRLGWTLDPRGVFVIPDVLVGITEIMRTLAKPGDRIVVCGSFLTVAAVSNQLTRQ